MNTAHFKQTFIYQPQQVSRNEEKLSEISLVFWHWKGCLSDAESLGSIIIIHTPVVLN